MKCVEFFRDEREFPPPKAVNSGSRKRGGETPPVLITFQSE
jgi:hypothetical protein